ncbi:dual OB domain-containing protein [Janthinobacterium lividum]|uniref:Dual OB-containing domain-containing protein n=1 Tax=Janthinobacterium lividum TaxID=29581 RepID=A0ABU0XW45_9BURK|nr:hypothetical protein [Janthinobacterium lividum]MDQ4627785.1 hypothetical protein [Janthinobacterium lividum]MDQ4676603.1 hypothetical protein [Janthinobacterium lividum]MDQ4686925.1 hypothetical protein [Janthinobacterium lividum]
MYNKTIICFANSKKPPSGRCIAGKELNGTDAGDWIRPVSARAGHEVSEDERAYEDGRKAQLLDIIRIPLIKRDILGHQTENHTLDNGYYWEKKGVATWDQVKAAVDRDDQLFWSHSQSTYHGSLDKVHKDDLQKIGTSLRLTEVGDLKIQVRSEDGYEGAPARRRVRASFTVLGQRHLLSVTDPEIEAQYLSGRDGDYPVGHAILCISLVEVWNDFAFRVIASVITPGRFG